MSLRARARVLLLACLFVGLVIGRLASVLAPISAAVAPAVCRVCHGCGVAEHDDVCDCEACHAVDEGRSEGGASVHEPAHDAVADHAVAAPAPGWAALFDVVPPRPSGARLLALPLGARWLPKGSDPPVVPPPERGA